jgi:DNA polymerase-3 subunit beta
MTTTTTALTVTLSPPALAAALQSVTRVISTRTTLPILNNVLMETTPEGLSLTATNLETGIRKLVPATIASEGAITVPAKLLADLAASLPDEPLTMTLAGETLSLRCGRFDTNIRGISADEFPPGPRPEGGDRLTIPLETLLRAIEQVHGFASTDEARPVLTGMLLDIEGTNLTMVATDGHRLAEKRLALNAEGQVGIDEDLATQGAKLIVPARALAELPRVFKGESGFVDVLVAKARNQIWFRAGTSEVASRLIDGQYPSYGKVIPAGDPLTTVRLSAADFLRDLRPVAQFARTSSHSLGLDVEPRDDAAGSEGRLRLSALTNEVGDSTAVLAAQVTGAELHIALNATYLASALEVLDETVEMRFAGPLSPALFKGDGLRVVVMPVRDGKPS